MTRRSTTLCALVLLAACAPIPKPPILDEADRVSQAEAAKAAKASAMPTWALAEKRRLMAHEAAETGLLAHAEFLAEESIATYEEGASLAALSDLFAVVVPDAAAVPD